MQLKELLTNDMLIALFSNLHKLATICLPIPISTASAEQSFSDMKLIKNRLRNRLTELSLSNLMKNVIESPENSLIVIWKKLLTCGIEKVDGLLCKLSFRLSLITHAYSHCSCTLSSTLSTTIMNFNTISKGGGGKKFHGGSLSPAPLNKTLE